MNSPSSNLKHSTTVSSLVKNILKHKRLYYSGNPEISDLEFDQLEDKLKAISPDHPVLQAVGDSQSSNKKASHSSPMLSLAKTYKREELIRWKKDFDIVGLLKIDGNSLSLIYKDGRLSLAKTRGDGRQGEDVTDKIMWVDSIPKQISIDGEVEVRGELYCSETEFDHICSAMVELELERPSSPRNIVAGMLGRKKHYELSSYFSFFAFDLIEPESTSNHEIKKLDALKSLGFSLPFPKLLKTENDVFEYLDFVNEHIQEGEIGIDGAVFTYNNTDSHEELGSTAHHPRFKIAFKWQGQTGISRIIRLDWFTSRLGIVTPVAVIEPIELSDAMIQNVTLHNAMHVKTYQLKSGDQIEIVRSGEVIPKFLRVTQSTEGPAEVAENCPSCNSKLVFDDVRLLCKNTEGCKAQAIGRILNWIRVVGIDDLSEKRLELLIQNNYVTSIPDLYTVTEEQLLTLPSFKETLAKKIVLNITQSKELALSTFLSGLGIAGVGRTKWEKLIQKFPTYKELCNTSVEEIADVDGFAEKTAAAILEGLKANQPLVNSLFSKGVSILESIQKQSTTHGRFAGLKFVITGTLSAPRKSIELQIRELGGDISSAVSAKTSYIVCNDRTSSSSKAKKAIELDIPFVSEEELTTLNPLAER